MKQNINEIKRMQQLAGVISENKVSNLETMFKIMKDYNNSPDAGRGQAEYQSINDFIYYLNDKGYSIVKQSTTSEAIEPGVGEDKLKNIILFF